MSNHSELRDFWPESIHFKNKCKFMLLKITLMPQTKKAFVWSKANTISTLQYPFQFCSDVSFTCKIFSRKWHLLFLPSLLISDLMFVFLLLSLLVFLQPDISKILFRIMSENNCSHKNAQPNIKHIWRTNWITSGYETTVRLWNITGDSAEWIRIIKAQFRGQVLGTPRLTALSLSAHTVFTRS